MSHFAAKACRNDQANGVMSDKVTDFAATVILPLIIAVAGVGRNKELLFMVSGGFLLVIRGQSTLMLIACRGGICGCPLYWPYI